MPTPSQRSMSARLAAYEKHARTDGREATAAARAAFLSRFERDVDPQGILPPAERARRAEHAKKAYFLKLALKSSKARQKKAVA